MITNTSITASVFLRKYLVERFYIHFRTLSQFPDNLPILEISSLMYKNYAKYSPRYSLFDRSSACLIACTLSLPPLFRVFFVVEIFRQLLLYKIILKPVWTYGYSCKGVRKQPLMQILFRGLKNRALRFVFVAPCFIYNKTFYRDLNTSYISDVIAEYAKKKPTMKFVWNTTQIIWYFYYSTILTRLVDANEL